MTDRLEKEKFYYAYYEKPEIAKSASGGMGYALAMSEIEKRVVYGVEYSPDYMRARYTRVTQSRRLVKLCGSKYIASDKKLSDGKTVYQHVSEDLKKGKKVLFFGLPCDVGAVKKYVERNNPDEADNLLTVDLVCQGPLEPEMQEAYIHFLEKEYKSTIKSFSVRYKNPYWQPVYLKAVFRNGKSHVKPLYDTDFGRAMIFYGREACTKCKFKGENHQSDLTIGDFWGMSDSEEGYNKMGSSVVVVHTEKGLKAFLEIRDIVRGEVTEKKALGENSMYYKSKPRHASFEVFQNVYREKGLHEAVFAVRSRLSRYKYYALLLSGRHPY